MPYIVYMYLSDTNYICTCTGIKGYTCTICICIYMYYVIPLNGKITHAEVTATFYLYYRYMELFSIHVLYIKKHVRVHTYQIRQTVIKPYVKERELYTHVLECGDELLSPLH